MFNAQGDVVALVDGTGKVVVEYSYDAWGQPLTITGSMKDTLGKANPLRYRCYVYDEETGLYYLGSRYYNPVMGRFINADGLISTGRSIIDSNMFAYSLNNPVTYKDYGGQFAVAAVVIGVVVGGMVLFAGCSSKKEQKHEPYKSANEAAQSFSEEIYSSSSYIRHEYATEIYSRTVDGKTTYNYNPPHSGKPHSASVGKSTPKGTKMVAYAHTHPNSNSFSNADINAAKKLGVDAYVVGPNLELQRYSLSSAVISNVGTIVPIELTDAQKNALIGEFQISWDTHIMEGCEFGCNSMAWPSP